MTHSIESIKAFTQMATNIDKNMEEETLYESKFDTSVHTGNRNCLINIEYSISFIFEDFEINFDSEKVILFDCY